MSREEFLLEELLHEEWTDHTEVVPELTQEQVGEWLRRGGPASPEEVLAWQARSPQLRHHYFRPTTVRGSRRKSVMGGHYGESFRIPHPTNPRWTLPLLKCWHCERRAVKIQGEMVLVEKTDTGYRVVSDRPLPECDNIAPRIVDHMRRDWWAQNAR